MKFERLGNIVDIQIGKTPKRNNPAYWGKGYSWVSISDMKGQTITETKEEITAIAIKECGCKLITKGTLLLSFKLSIGKVAFAGKDLYTNEAICGLFIKDITKVYPPYLYYVLKLSKLTGSNVAAKGATLNSASLNAIKLPFPNSLSDQIRIATLLSKAETLITQRKETIQLLDEYIRSVFAEMFGDPVRNEKKWEIKTIGDLVKKEKHSLKRGPFGGALKKEIFVPKGYLVYEQFHALNNDFTFERYYIDEEKFNELRAFEVLPGDIIVSCSGVYLGKLAIVPKNARKGIINQALLKISLDNNIISNQFFVSVFSHESFKNKFYGSSIGSGIPNFPPMEDFKKFKFIYPPINLQSKFSIIVEKAELLKRQYQKSLQELEDLFGGLSKQSFKGELDLKRIKSKSIEEEIEKVLKGDKQIEPVDILPNNEKKEDTRYGDPFEVDEATAKKQGSWFYKEWLRLHGKAIENENQSAWLQSKQNGLASVPLKFTLAEGNAIIDEIFAKQNRGFSYTEFEMLLKNEKITYTAKEIKDFIFQKLEEKELVQLYASKEWMEAIRNPKFNPPGGFSGEGSIWFLVNKTEKAK